MARTIYGDHKRFLDTYMKPFPGIQKMFRLHFLFFFSKLFFLGFYFTGDGAHLDIDGHIQITGRVDDVINVR
jgi:acetyl-CoA synthetase